MILRGSRVTAIARGSRRLWTPTVIQTALWLDANDASTITLNGSTVSQWSDKSGNGRHATQAVAVNQPAWGVGRNLLLWSEEFQQAAWVKRGTCTVTPNNAIAPDGTLTADLISGINTTTNDIYNGNYLTFVMGTAGASITPSIFVKRVSTSGVFTIGNSVNDNLYGRWRVNTAQLPDAWVRLESTTPGVTVEVPFILDPNGYGGVLLRGVSGGPLSMHLWGAQINPGTTAGPYQRTTSAAQTVVTGINGKPTLGWTGANGIFLDTAAWALAPNRKYATVAVAASPTWGGGNRFGRIWVSRSGYPQGYLGQGEQAGSALAIGGTMLTTGAVTGVSGANVVSHSFGTSGLSDNAFDIAVNGGTPVSLTGNTGALGTAGIRIGADLTVTNGGNTWDGQIGEIVIVSGDLSAADRRRLEGYQAWKWGLEAKLPDTHPYKNTPPLV